MKTDTLDDVKNWLRSGKCAIFIVRHAERTKIDPKDPTFGDTLPITAEGVRSARALGAMLAEFAPLASFVSSPLMRTRMTASCIAEGMGLHGADIPVDGKLGNESFFYEDNAKVLAAFTPPENFFPACFEYMEKGALDGFHPLAESADAMEAWLDARLETPLLVAATHDLYIAAFLAARGAYPERSRDTWPRFLDAGAIYIDDDGARRYALVRTGLSDRIVGVRS